MDGCIIKTAMMTGSKFVEGLCDKKSQFSNPAQPPKPEHEPKQTLSLDYHHMDHLEG
jgi:hypothetical protein